jgi:hypothetical protein
MLKKLYVSRQLLNAKDLIQWAKDQGLKQCLHEKEFHVTLTYSKTPVDWNNWTPLENKFNYKKKDREIKKFGKCIVLAINSEYLTKRWQEFMDGGCSWDYDNNYQPHITITYEGDDINPDDIEPYEGLLVFGPEHFEGLNETIDIKSTIQHISLDESVFHITDENQDALYDKFKSTYEKATGVAWSKDKFLSRARHWQFYGNEDGYITLRPQNSGFYKLTGMVGSPQGILQGMKELQHSGMPVWGAVSETLARVAKRNGMVVPSMMTGGPFILKAIFKTIPKNVLGDVQDLKVNDDGSLTLMFNDIGEVKKYFICNKEYLMKLIKLPEFLEKISTVPGAGLFFKLLGINI